MGKSATLSDYRLAPNRNRLTITLTAVAGVWRRQSFIPLAKDLRESQRGKRDSVAFLTMPRSLTNVNDVGSRDPQDLGFSNHPLPL